ncbi:MAG: MBL fold metallo-hydrolase [Blautia sp.]
MTDKPYDVVLTHGHLDHVGGIGAFTDVYLRRGTILI